MQRTNIYLDEKQIEALRRLGDQLGQPVAVLVREAVDAWLKSKGVRVIGENEWRHRFEALLDRRRALAGEGGWTVDEVETDVAEAVREVRAAAGRR